MSKRENTSDATGNRLGGESSPYLLQHAHNPVDWFPWGPEALEKARRENKPIFLSVGYSTCYWCHVMERQCFEDETIAAEMNRLFVNIKVDREERPDLDQLYMLAVQLITRHGGWPMSVWLMPDLRPFYGGTYFPPSNFVGYLRGLEDAYRNRRHEVDRSAEQITGMLRRLSRPSPPDKPLRVAVDWVESLIDRSVSDYDARFGGFGGAPKFPRETLLELLLVYLADADQQSTGSTRAAEITRMLRHALDSMAAGGIRDQLGGGFHRYSTDAQWLVPHFEIMLYDNAMLGWVYAEASRQFREPRYARIARGIFDFVLREMTSPEGAFYTAFDAEVDAQEGLSYLWTADEVESLLGHDDAKLFGRVYGVDRGPNFADPHHGSGHPDKNILYLPEPLENVAAGLNVGVEELEQKLESMRQTLYSARVRRKQPLLDTKIITSWNALMIRALAHGGSVLSESRYVEAAARGAEFLLSNHTADDGILFRTSRNGTRKQQGFLDDYAFLAQSLLALHQATGDERWRREAVRVKEAMIGRFDDVQAGGLFFTSRDATDLIVRQKTSQDSPLPSGNAVAAMVLLAVGEPSNARRILWAFAQQTADQGEAMSSMIEAMLLYLRQSEPFTVSVSPTASPLDRPATPQQVAAGVVAARAEWVSASELHVRLNILDGFHINAHDPGGNLGLVATRLTSDDAGVVVDYPSGTEMSFHFSDQPVRVYSGEVMIRVRFALPVAADARIRLALAYQACDESACLPPVTKIIDVDEPSVH